jgi:hypothetical protein
MVMVPAPGKAELVPADSELGDRRAIGDGVFPAAAGGCLQGLTRFGGAAGVVWR